MTSLPIRADLVGRKPYGAPQIDVPVRLNTNENPFAPSPELSAAIADDVRAIAPSLNRYPDREALDLRVDLAKYISAESSVAVTAENIWPANGSNEVMMQLLQLFGGPGKKLVTFSPTYSMYEDYCRDSFTAFEMVARNSNFEVDSEVVDIALRLNPDIIILTSPNNPTGTLLPSEIIDYILLNFSGVLIVDEAYAEFRELGTPSAVTKIGQNSHVIVTRTMSKAFSFAGARLGYAVADPSVVQAIQLVRLPYHLSAVTQSVARTALRFRDELQGQVGVLRSERNALATWFSENGFEVLPSGANFLLFGTFSDRTKIWEELVAKGVLIRETGPEGWLRVSIGTPAENQFFKDALLEVTR
jgi:histidinol-phosphate aminotransferase